MIHRDSVRLGPAAQVIKLHNVVGLALASCDDPLGADPTPLESLVASAVTPEAFIVCNVRMLLTRGTNC